MKAITFLKNLATYRTVVSVFISIVLKVLVATRVTEASSLAEVDNVTNYVLTAASVLADGLGIYFRLKGTKPGLLTPQYAAHEAWLNSGVDRRGDGGTPPGAAITEAG